MDESSILNMTNGGEMYVSSLESESLSAAAQSGALLYTSATLISSASVLSGIAMASAKGNIMNVYSGGTALDIKMGNKTSMSIFDGGNASNVFVSSGAKMFVSSGGTASDLTLDGAVTISDGGVVDGVSVTLISEDSASMTVNAGGVLIHSNLCLNVTVNAEGLITDGTFGSKLTIKDGGSASKIYVYSDATFYPTASGVNIYVCEGGQIINSACVISGVYVESGGILAGALLQGSGTRAYISEFKYAKTKTVVSAYITGDAHNLHASAAGTLKPNLRVASGGAVYDSIFDGNKVYLFAESGAILQNCSVTNGATVNVSSGATAINTMVTSGGLLKILNGSTLKGLRSESTGIVNALKSYAFTLDFDMNYYDGKAFITDLAIIGAEQRKKATTANLYYSNYNITYTITLDDVITGGTYKLAGGLTEAFGLLTDKTFTVYADDGTTSLGTMKIGTDFTTTDGTKLSLSTVKTGSTYELDLTVSNVETPSLNVTTADDIVNAHDNKISFKEAMAYAKRGGVSTVEGHVGEACITFDSSIKSISLPAFDASASNISIDMSGVQVNVQEATSYSQDTTIDNANLAREITSVTEKYLTNGISTTAKVTVNGDTSLTLDLGTAAADVPVIGAALVKANGTYIQSGKVTLTIKSGTFNTTIFGGVAGIKNGYAENSSVGSVDITVDASAKNIAIAGNIYVAGAGKAKVNGDAQITFKGSMLTVTGAVIGDSNYAIRGGSFTTGGRYVQGNRIISFDSFSGNFGAKAVIGFDKAEFSNASNVNFTNARVNLEDISNWSFSDGAAIQLADGITNSFAGDTMNLSGTYENTATIIDGNSAAAVAGFADLTAVTLFGESTQWDSASSAWVSDSYKLALDSANNDVVLSKLA